MEDSTEKKELEVLTELSVKPHAFNPGQQLNSTDGYNVLLELPRVEKLAKKKNGITEASVTPHLVLRKEDLILS